MMIDKNAVAIVLTAVAGLVAPPSARLEAQQPQLPEGEWTGIITPPEAYDISVSYQVHADSGSLHIALVVGEDRFYPFRDIRPGEGRLHFRWTPGAEVRCELVLSEDGSYAGTCVGDDGETGRLIMIPPVRQNQEDIGGSCARPVLVDGLDAVVID